MNAFCFEATTKLVKTPCHIFNIKRKYHKRSAANFPCLFIFIKQARLHEMLKTRHQMPKQLTAR